LQICHIFNNNHIHFKIVRRRTGMTHQQRVSRSGSRIIEWDVNELHQRPLLAFVLEEDILSTCSNDKKFELMLTRRPKAYSSSGSVV